MSNSLREEIAKWLYLQSYPTGDWLRLHDASQKYYLIRADSILSLIDQHFDELMMKRGYTKEDR